MTETNYGHYLDYQCFVCLCLSFLPFCCTFLCTTVHGVMSDTPLPASRNALINVCCFKPTTTTAAINVLYTPHSYNASMNCDMKFQINAVLRDDCEHKIMLNSQVIIQMDCFFTVSSLIFIDFILLLFSIRVKLRSENELTQVSREDFVIEY